MLHGVSGPIHTAPASGDVFPENVTFDIVNLPLVAIAPPRSRDVFHANVLRWICRSALAPDAIAPPVPPSFRLMSESKMRVMYPLEIAPAAPLVDVLPEIDDRSTRSSPPGTVTVVPDIEGPATTTAPPAAAEVLPTRNESYTPRPACWPTNTAPALPPVKVMLWRPISAGAEPDLVIWKCGPLGGPSNVTNPPPSIVRRRLMVRVDWIGISTGSGPQSKLIPDTLTSARYEASAALVQLPGVPSPTTRWPAANVRNEYQSLYW